MSRQRRDSLIVNNFFTLASIIMISIVLILYSKFGPKKEEKPRVNSNLECQNITKTIDKISSLELMKDANYYLENGLFVLDGAFIKPRFGKFYLKDKITIPEANSFFIDSLNYKAKENPVKYLTIKYEIIENDKNDPRKKTLEEKNYAGNLLTSIRLNGKELFMMNTNFLEYDKNDIKNRIECTIKAFKENAK